MVWSRSKLSIYILYKFFPEVAAGSSTHCCILLKRVRAVSQCFWNLHLEVRFLVFLCFELLHSSKGVCNSNWRLGGGVLGKLRRDAAQIVAVNQKQNWVNFLDFFLCKNCMVKVRLVRPRLTVYSWTAASKDHVPFCWYCALVWSVKSERAIGRIWLLRSVRYLYTLVRSSILQALLSSDKANSTLS